MTYRTFAETDPLDTEYLLARRPFIPRGALTVIYGEGSVGKGRMTASWIAEIINSGPAAAVVVIWPEDHESESAVKRLISAGVSDLGRVINLSKLEDGSRFKLSTSPKVAGHAGVLRETIAEAEADGLTVKAVFIDPIARATIGALTSNTAVTHTLEQLWDLAESTGVAMVVVAHTVTGGKLQGSMAMSQYPRWVYQVVKDPANPTMRIVRAEKANDAGFVPDVRFTIEPGTDGRVRVVWLTLADIEERQRAWRKAAFALTMADRGGSRIIGGYKSTRQARRAAETDAGVKLAGWARHPGYDATETVQVTRPDGTEVAYAIARKGAA